MPCGEVVAALDTSATDGLSANEAERRLQRHGPNRLAESPPDPVWKRFLAQISDFTVLALLAAAALAGLLGAFMPMNHTAFLERYGDSLAILAIVVLNAVLGLLQERRAERALEALRMMAAPSARAQRDGHPVDVQAPSLVPGDLLLLEEGDRVPADLRLCSAHELEVEEAALTGESLPVLKDAGTALDEDAPLADRRTMAFMGTRVARGRGRGVVVATGMETELGRIAGMLARVEMEPTPLEEDLERFGKKIVLGCVAISVVVFAAGMMMAWKVGKPLGIEARDLFLVAVALAVAAIPEGLPAVTTIVLALGTQRMAKRNALVRRLPAIETLGCTQVVCTDKTGTLTQNHMTVVRAWTAESRFAVEHGPDGAIERGPEPGVPDVTDPAGTATAAGREPLVPLLARPDLRLLLRASADATDAALLAFAWKGREREPAPPLAEQPFTSQRRMASVIVEEDGVTRSFVRGAPEAVLARCKSIHRGGEARPMTEPDRVAASQEALRWSEEAMRVIALAYREAPRAEVAGDPEDRLTFVGLVGIHDPPRPEVGAAIDEAREAGIRTLMITGDHPATGRAIAREIGLWREGDEVITGDAVARMGEAELAEVAPRLRVVARATAQNKLQIVEALKTKGLVCAMTGDGVNDAPAVKAASIGVAMGRAGTDVTKEAADLILADDNYATIVAAVEEGRAIYANIRKFIFFLLSSNAGLVPVVLVASLAGWPQPLAPIQILWINLITNGLPALALGVDKADPDLMRQPPRPPGSSILSGHEYVEVLVIGGIMSVTALWAFHHVWTAGVLPEPAALDRARTVCFAILAIGPLLHALNCRSKTRSLFSLGVFSNPWLWGSIAVGVLLQALTVAIPPLRPFFKTGTATLFPLDGEALVLIGAMSVVPFVVGELVKLFGGPPSARREARPT